MFKCYEVRFQNSARMELSSLKYELESQQSDLVCRSADGDLDEFTDLQQSTEIWRVIAGVIISPIIGLISDILIKLWKNYKNGSQDVLYTIPCFLTLAAVTVGLAFSLLWTNIWPTMTFVAFSTALIYTYENMSIVSSQGCKVTSRSHRLYTSICIKHGA